MPCGNSFSARAQSAATGPMHIRHIITCNQVVMLMWRWLLPLLLLATSSALFLIVPINSAGLDGVPTIITFAAAAVNFTADAPTSVANGGSYLSAFRVQCDDQPTTWSGALSRCSAMGAGWALATVNSQAAQDAIVGLQSNQNIWLGASDATTLNAWTWQTGRLQGKVFYRGRMNATTISCVDPPCACESSMYCQWRSGQPDDSQSVENWMNIFASSAAYPTPQWNDFPNAPVGKYAVHCYACERSLCSIPADCNATNTLSVNTSKYFVFGEPCGCVCKPGFTGPRCDNPIVPVNTGAYTAEYAVQCASQGVTYPMARDACAAAGPGWALASVPSRSAFERLTNLTVFRTWIGGSDEGHHATWQWRFGRLTNRTFYHGNFASNACNAPPCACEPGMFCHWHEPKQPNDFNGYQHYLEMFGTEATLGEPNISYLWNDLEAWSVAPQCYACERSACDIALDCNATNTLSVNTSKYYVFGEPCGCVCKPGFTGPRCDETSPFFDVNGRYMSQFAVQCEASPMSWTQALPKCPALSKEWTLATLPTNASTLWMASVTLTQTQNSKYVWVGASDDAVEGEWRWVGGGRLHNALFYRGAKTAGSCTMPPCACDPAVTFCPFTPGSPDNSGGPENFGVLSTSLGMLSDFKLSPAANWYVYCYACERSFCSLNADCNATNTLSVNTSKYYVFGEPCGCVCKPGFSGPRCDDATPTVVVNGSYTAELAVVCASQFISWTDSGAACRARGPDWDLATIGSQSAQDAIAAQYSGFIWLGGSDAGHAANFTWEAGRLKGRTFYVGDKDLNVCTTPPCACEPGMFCKWHEPKQPDGGPGEDYLHMVSTDPIYGGRTWNDARDSFVIACYACERSACDIELDCNATNTLSVNASKYYVFGEPCGCVCKPGFNGPRCNDPIFTFDTTMTTTTDAQTTTAVMTTATETTSSVSPSSEASTTTTTEETTSTSVSAFTTSPPPPATTTTTTTTSTDESTSTTTTSGVFSTTTPAPPPPLTSTAETTTTTAASATTTAATSEAATTSASTTPEPTTTTSTGSPPPPPPPPGSAPANDCPLTQGDLTISTTTLRRPASTTTSTTTTSSHVANGASANPPTVVDVFFAFPDARILAHSTTTTSNNNSVAPPPPSSVSFDPVWEPALPEGVTVAACAISRQSMTAAAIRCTATLHPATTAVVTAAITASWVVPPQFLSVACAAAATAAAAGHHNNSSSSSSSGFARLVITVLPAPDSTADGGQATIVVRIGAALFAATSLPAVLGDPTAVEFQLGLMMLLSGCVPEPLRDAARYAKYLLSPLIDLGPAAVIAGHVGAAFITLIIHSIVTAAYASTSSTTSTSAPPSRWARFINAWPASRFPSVSFAVAAVLYPGVAHCAAAVAEIATGGGGGGSAVLLILGLLFLIAVPVGGAVLILRVGSTSTFCVIDDPPPQTNHILHHRHYPFNRCGRVLAWLRTPQGYWGPSSVERAVGAVRGFGNHRGRLLLLPHACLSIAVAYLSTAIQTTTTSSQSMSSVSVSCAPRLYAAGSLLLAASITVGLLRPFRHTLTTCLTSLSLASAGLVGLLAAAAATTTTEASKKIQNPADAGNANQNSSSSSSSSFQRAAIAFLFIAAALTLLRTLHWCALSALVGGGDGLKQSLEQSNENDNALLTPSSGPESEEMRGLQTTL